MSEREHLDKKMNPLKEPLKKTNMITTKLASYKLIVKTFGTGAHVILPKVLKGKEVIVVYVE